jgi:hypothetical protein
MTLITILFYLETVTTGTVGTTTTIGDIPNIVDGITVGVSILLLGFIGRMLDRWFNRYQGLELEDNNQDQEQE